MKFNINDTVKVKLTEFGIDILRKQHEMYLKKFGEFVPPTPDSDGYVTYQLWELMSTFGPRMYLGGEIPFETDIILDTE